MSVLPWRPFDLNLFVVVVIFLIWFFGSEIRWRVKEALAGRLTYDGGGKIDSALRANFDVINLVPPGPFYPKSLAGNAVKSTKSSTSTRSKRETTTRPDVNRLTNVTAGPPISTSTTVSFFSFFKNHKIKFINFPPLAPGSMI